MDVNIPLAAYSLAHHAFKRGAIYTADALDNALEAAAPLIVAAELDRIVGEIHEDGRLAVGSALDVEMFLRGRAEELRGDA